MRDLIGGAVAGRDGRRSLGGDDRFAGVKKKKRKKRAEAFNRAEQEGPGGGGRGPHGLAGISLHENLRRSLPKLFVHCRPGNFPHHNRASGLRPQCENVKARGRLAAFEDSRFSAGCFPRALL